MGHRCYFWLCLVCMVMPCTPLGLAQPTGQPAPFVFHLSFPAPIIQTVGSECRITSAEAPGLLAIRGSRSCRGTR